MGLSPPDLKGRVAIVTGASRGVGKAVALALARQGCRIAAAAKSMESTPRLPGSIVETAAEVAELGVESIAVQTDVRDEAAIEHMVEETVRSLGRVDILVNNAGALWWKDVVDTPAKRFDLVMDVNARASFLAARACIPHMVEQKWGHIITMSPPLMLEMVPGKVAYCVSKFGMTLLCMGLAQELKGRNVAANALWPATVIESQATINYGLGSPEVWRKADILADATLAIVGREPRTMSGRALLDEEILAESGVLDFDQYSCVPGGEPIRIAGPGLTTKSFGHDTGGSTA